ncbi:MAG: type II toxin-antitoxin system RelE/ParE family toxin [Candidatus Korarchaeota archaeon]|nr:type II toxin-antitoxin system RelE/ParE family toxin [Candidatus Korarchaeota archaeon]
MWRLVPTSRFRKRLGKLDPPVVREILRDVRESGLERDPTTGKRLKGSFPVDTPMGRVEAPIWELKVGPRRAYRVFYAISWEERAIYLLDVWHRKRGFRRMKFKIPSILLGLPEFLRLLLGELPLLDQLV